MYDFSAFANGDYVVKIKNSMELYSFLSLCEEHHFNWASGCKGTEYFEGAAHSLDNGGELYLFGNGDLTMSRSYWGEIEQEGIISPEAIVGYKKIPPLADFTLDISRFPYGDVDYFLSESGYTKAMPFKPAANGQTPYISGFTDLSNIRIALERIFR